jgi:hypothetical protein
MSAVARNWAVVVAILLAAPLTAHAQKPDDSLFLGSGKCRNCHVQRTGDRDEQFVLLTEYVTWALSDKHALAYVALEGNRGQQIGKALGIDVRTDASCLACHAVSTPDRIHEDTDHGIARQGVGCEACHGAAGTRTGEEKAWLDNHAKKPWRKKTAEEKEAAGLTDLRNPAKRAEVCMSCHLSDASQGRVVTHAMFAAGHPPLQSFDLPSASERMPRHWRLAPDVPYLQSEDKTIRDNYHFGTAGSANTQAAIGTGLASLARMTQLVEERAAGTAKWSERQLAMFKDLNDAELWPQIAMAHSDCAACHHELRRPSWRQLRGYHGAPGRPPLPAWTVALPRAGIGADAKQVSAALKSLDDAIRRQPFGDREQLPTAAAQARRGAFPADWRTTIYSIEASPALARAIATPAVEEPYVDFDSARQIVAAFAAVYQDGVRSRQKIKASPEIDAWLAKWTDQLALNLDADTLRQRRGIMLQALGGIADGPAAYQALDYLATHGAEEMDEKGGTDLMKAGNLVLQRLAKLKGTQPFFDALIRPADSQGPALLQKLEAVNEEQGRKIRERARAFDGLLFTKERERLSKLLAAE